jgi:2-polyprenyl-3-methyl-5-hydroxy-6-metoxy-1,4-benzoquinol methylase
MTEERIGKEYYDSTAYFDDPAHLMDPHSPFQRYRVAKVLQIHRPQPDDRVVDLGCGWGTFSFELAKCAAEVVGVDFSEKSIELCNRRLTGEPMYNLRFLCADAGQTGLEGEAWDLVIAADLFEHLPTVSCVPEAVCPCGRPIAAICWKSSRTVTSSSPGT